VLDPLALKVLQGEFMEGDHIVVDADGDRLTFRAGAREAVAAGCPP
jgi:ATP-dependent Clp protease ATP-binding subunit ClpB